MRIRVVDLETTGFEPTDAVVEIAACDLRDGAISAFLISTLVNPGRPIPPQVSAVHHIIDADVQGCPTWDDAWPAYVHDVQAFCAHNAKFERQWLTDEVTDGKPWICTLRCAYRLWPDAPGHSNQTLRYWLNPEGLDRTIASVAHRAGPDAYVTAFILREQLKLATFDALVAWSSEPALLPRITFGKHRGLAWKDAPIDYLQWITRTADMGEDVVHTARHWIKAAGGTR